MTTHHLAILVATFVVSFCVAAAPGIGWYLINRFILHPEYWLPPEEMRQWIRDHPTTR